MAEENIVKLTKAVSEFEKAYREVKRLAKIVTNIGEWLSERPYKLSVSKVEFIIEAYNEREYELNSSEWPSAKDIGEALATLHIKRKQVKSIFNSLSREEQQMVRLPDYL